MSFVVFVPPPRISQAEAYALLDDEGSAEPPVGALRGYIDALIVRKRVFVDEQQCRWSEEIDADDERAFHWVIHASMSASGTADLRNGSDPFERRKSAGGQVPVGTVRIVPPPHRPHPAPGSVDGVGGTPVTARANGGDQPTRFHDGHEPYVKLGRLATVKQFRGLGLGRLVVGEALSWVARNADRVLQLPHEAVERERAIRAGAEWRGLVLAHTQISAVKFYESLGFEIDPELGEWTEEGIQHVAMWKRVELKNN